VLFEFPTIIKPPSLLRDTLSAASKAEPPKVFCHTKSPSSSILINQISDSPLLSETSISLLKVLPVIT